MHRTVSTSVLAAVALLAMPASAAALTATNVRIAEHAGFVRVVVDFSGGRLEVNDADALDPAPIDGAARVAVRGRGIGTRAAARSAGGVRVRVTQGEGRIVIRLGSGRRALKYLRVWGLHRPERLVLDLYRARPPSAAAEIRTGRAGCLSLTSISPDGRTFAVRGVERRLFEAAFVLRVRDRSGRVVGRRVMTARGAWSARVSFGVPSAQLGTLEGVAASAKDGSLDCLVQRRVGLNP